jgi:hypothetical protein
MTRRKGVYHGTLECFIYVLICHVPVFHVLQLRNKLQKIDMFCFAHHLDILFGLKCTCGLIIYASYIFSISFTYHLRTNGSIFSKINVKFLKTPYFRFCSGTGYLSSFEFLYHRHPLIFLHIGTIKARHMLLFVLIVSLFTMNFYRLVIHRWFVLSREWPVHVQRGFRYGYAPWCLYYVFKRFKNLLYRSRTWQWPICCKCWYIIIYIYLN